MPQEFHSLAESMNVRFPVLIVLSLGLVAPSAGAPGGPSACYLYTSLAFQKAGGPHRLGPVSTLGECETIREARFRGALIRAANAPRSESRRRPRPAISTRRSPTSAGAEPTGSALSRPATPASRPVIRFFADRRTRVATAPSV